MKERARKSGIDVVGAVPWGTHLCQFYETKQDLIDILVPYFKAGLEDNESCIWVTTEPLGKKEAEEVLRKAVPNFTQYLEEGQLEIVPHTGFYFTDGVQHFDHDTQQNHLAPNTMSDLLFKGALREHSRSVWQGMIYVAPGAQKTDGYQANRNLLLDSNARADSIPGLEILADDVRCTHGATIGKIDPDQVFYLRSRGIPDKESERLIVEGFFDPIMQRIPFGGVRTRFQDAILKKMG